MTIEKLLSHHAVLIRNIHARERQTVEAPSRLRMLFSVILRHNSIQNSELLNHFGIDIRKKSVLDAITIRKFLETRLRIITYAINLDIVRCKLTQSVLQLDQLRAAVRSPHNRAVKDNNRL